MVDSNYPPDWNKRRHKLFKQFGWECQDCGDHIPKTSDRELHAHHIRPISEGGGHSLDNLLPLCLDCHRNIHSSGQSPDLLPREKYDCVYCDFTYVRDTAIKGSFCSFDCWALFRANKQLNWLDDNNCVCSTCYAHFPPDANVCPNCDNWDLRQDNSAHLDGFELDLKNALGHAIKNLHEHKVADS